MGRRENIFELLKDYEETYNRPLPITYDLLKLSDEHRGFDALIRRYWDTLHPLSRDIFTSFANEIQYLIHILSENEEQLELKNNEIENLKNLFEEKLAGFELDFENRINQGIATVSNKNFDIMDRENQILKKNVIELSDKIKNKDELNENLRKEISLLIDDSDEQEETAKMLEENINESINQYQNFTNQLDVFEDVMNTLQNANIAAEHKIDELAEELDLKSGLINDVKTTYQKSLEISESRFETLKDKVKQISPQITQIHERSNQLHAQNKKLLNEISQLKKNENVSPSTSNITENLESQINFLKEKNSKLEDEIGHLTANIEIMNLKQSQQDDVLSGYKTMVFENKTSSSSIPVPKKQQYTLKPQPVNQPDIAKIKELNNTKTLDENAIPKIKEIPSKKLTKSSMQEIIEENKIEEDDEENVKQVIKEVLMRDPKSQESTKEHIDEETKGEVQAKKVKKSASKEKLFS